MKRKIPWSKARFTVPSVCTARWAKADWFAYASRRNGGAEIVDDGTYVLGPSETKRAWRERL